MANQKSNNKNKVKALKGTLAFVLTICIAGAIVLGVGFGVYGTDTSKWFRKAEEAQEQEQAPETEEEQNPLVVETFYENGIALASADADIATYSTNQRSLTAKITPENTDIYGVTWSVAWKDAESEWATGKAVTDYVAIGYNDSPHAESLKATLTCKQAFGEQVIVTVTSNLMDSVTASATVDYMRRIDNYSIKFECEAGDEYNFTLDDSVDEDPQGNGLFVFGSSTGRAPSYCFNVHVDYSLGTIQANDPVLRLITGYDDSNNAIYEDIDTKSDYEFNVGSDGSIRIVFSYNNETVGAWEIGIKETPTSISINNSAIVF